MSSEDQRWTSPSGKPLRKDPDGQGYWLDEPGGVAYLYPPETVNGIQSFPLEGSWGDNPYSFGGGALPSTSVVRIVTAANTALVTPDHLCPDLLRHENIGGADGVRGRVVRGFFWLLRAWPPRERR